MADFGYVYDKFIQPHEAYYVNNPADPGGRTYGGIAQNIFPNWEGWPWLINWIARNGEPKWNQQFKELDPLVRKFFEELYFKNRFHEIHSRDIAAIFFDWFVNTIKVYAQTGSSVPVKEVQKMLGITADGKMGPITINAINRANTSDLFNKIKSARESFYQRLVARDGSLAQFLAGWMRRIQKFTLTEGGSGIAVLILIIVLFFVFMISI